MKTHGTNATGRSLAAGTRKLAKKIIKVTGIAVLGVGSAMTVAVMAFERRTYDDAPLPAIAASSDPAVIARGKYLVYGAAHCVDCHGDPAREAEAAVGKEIPLLGGREIKLPLGTFRPPNITPDPETGIGKMTDAELARSLRHGVRRDGRTLVPFMPFANVADEDLAAIISYLRAQPPVRNAVTTRSLTPLGHVVLAFLIKPEGPKGAVPARVPPAATAEYGRYIAHDVANCFGCHTERDMRTGKFVGAPFAGGTHFVENRHGRTYEFVTPNLTPEPKTGRIANWDEETFVARLRMGRGAEGSPMPWPAFGRLADDDLRAVYRYLRSVPAVERDTGATVRGPELPTGPTAAR